MKKLTGHIKRHPDGFGFFIPDEVDFPDVYIPKKYMVGVMSNDKVEIDVRQEPGGDRFRGKVTKIIERGIRQVTGQIHRMNSRRGMLLDASRAWGENLYIKLEASVKFDEGEWASVEILTYPGSAKGFTGRLLKIIGDSVNPSTDNLRVLYSHEIPMEFSKESLQELNLLPDEVSEKDMKDRRDLRQDTFITIDGATAKDFDDAILVETTKEGFILKVAIADVSHYVKGQSAIDKDAYLRGNSTYLPNFVAPMLPEKLSNNLCSLRPNVPRLAVVAEMHMDFSGEFTRNEFYEAVIESKARVTYGEAQEVVDGNCPEKLYPVQAQIKHAADLAKILMAKRFKEGSLNLEIPATEVEVDEAGQPIDIIKADRLFAHCLIEEMMLAANIAVAKFLEENEAPGLFRIHDAPDEDNVRNLERFMHNFGFSKKLSGGKLQKKITRALQEFKGRPQEHILHILTLRSMKQAVYSADNIGHFGLGFSDYVHFTSPIRRYPDLIIHRQLKAILCPQKGYPMIPYELLKDFGVHLSACEQRSVKAERQLVSIKKARFMEKFVGEEFEGVISSVAKFGVFVLLRRFDVDGLVRVEELGRDHFEFDEENLRLVGNKTGKVYAMGDIIEVVVASVDTDEGRVDFLMSGEYIAPTPRAKEVKVAKSHHKKKSKPSKTRLSLKTNRRGLREARVSKSRRKGKTR